MTRLILAITFLMGALAAPADAGRFDFLEDVDWGGCEEHFKEITDTWYEYELDNYIGLAVAYHESRCNPQSVSSAGACGIMQVIPYSDRPGCTQLKDPEVGIEWGAKILRSYGAHSDRRKALAAYVCGPAAWRGCKSNADRRIATAERFREEAEAARGNS